MLSMLMTTEYAPAEERRELQRLLIRVAGGDRDALAELYQRTRAAVYGLALSYLKNAHDAQDLTQDVYVQVWDRAEQYHPNQHENEENDKEKMDIAHRRLPCGDAARRRTVLPAGERGCVRGVAGCEPEH